MYTQLSTECKIILLHSEFRSISSALMTANVARRMPNRAAVEDMMMLGSVLVSELIIAISVCTNEITRAFYREKRQPLTFEPALVFRDIRQNVVSIRKEDHVYVFRSWVIVTWLENEVIKRFGSVCNSWEGQK